MDIKVGDFVLAYNPDQDTKVVGKVSTINVKPYHPLIKISI